jgi:hydroxymethylbilane synthase
LHLIECQLFIMSSIIIGSRGSELALWQSNYAKAALEKLGHVVEIKIIKTQGDIIQDLSFDKMEGKGFFTKELEDSLLRGDIDLAVHSMKDLQTTSHPELVVTAVSYREDPSDTLLIKNDSYNPSLELGLPLNARVGTSSMRRKAQLKDIRPDIETVDIRGNVPTRINKLFKENLDAIILANAGLKRIQPEMRDAIVKVLHPREFVPAPAQGVLAYQTLAKNKPLRRILSQIHNSDVAQQTNIERGVLKAMEGGCLIPLGVYCEIDTLGYFHVWSAYSEDLEAPLKRHHISTATSAGLVDEIVRELKS